MTSYLQSGWPLLLLMGFVSVFSLSFDLVGMTFLLSTSLSAGSLGITAPRQASLALMYWIFSFTFLGLLPWLHYSEHVVIWRSAVLDQKTLIGANLMILFANFLVLIAYCLAHRKRYSIKTEKHYVILRPNTSALVLLLISTLGFLGVLVTNSFDVRLLLFRGLVDQTREVVFSSSVTGLVFVMVSRMAPVFAFYFMITEVPGKSIVKATLFILLVASVFPTGVARYLVAYTYIPMLMIMLPSFRSGTRFALAILFSLLVIFPLLNQFRYFSSFADLRILPPKEFFFAGHFDAFENLAAAMEAKFVSGGYQLLGALLFFVPRTYWPDKPVGSGYEMAEHLEYDFSNISMPFLAEGYVNFGLPGVMLFAVVIGYLMGRLDCVMAPGDVSRRHLTYRNTVYYFFFGALFFVLRGDLLSSLAYLIASLCVALVIGGSMRLLNSRFRTCVRPI